MNYISLAFLLSAYSLVVAQHDEWHITASNNDEYTGLAMANGRTGMLTPPEPFRIEHPVLNKRV